MGQEALLAIVTIWQIGRLADWQIGRGEEFIKEGSANWEGC